MFIKLQRNSFFWKIQCQSVVFLSCLRGKSVSTISSAHTQKQSQHLIETKKEVDHHDAFAEDWWNVDGVFRPLHALNEIRVPFIRDGLVARGNIDDALVNTSRVLQNQQILEVGCGGGILTEQLARLAATVTALDLAPGLINSAREHLEKSSSDLKLNIVYKVEDVAVHAITHREKYDAVVVSEVIEHISDKFKFLTDCVTALKPGGSIFITTINKTIPLWIAGILIAEYVLKIVPAGTHHWDKLISPQDLQAMLSNLNCQTVLINGSMYDFYQNKWRWINSTRLCYAMHAIKDGQCV